MKFIALALGSLLALTPLAARAESTPPSDAPSASVDPPRRQREWYGWQTLLADTASFAVFFTAAHHDSTGAVDLGMGTFALVPPVIHLAHENAGGAGLSVALRLGLPLAGGLIGNAAANPKDDWQPLIDIYLGALLGAVAASIVDASVLAYDARPLAPPSPKPDTKAFRVAPSVGALRGGLSAGLTGTF
jgi:hypothetical protein